MEYSISYDCFVGMVNYMICLSINDRCDRCINYPLYSTVLGGSSTFPV